MGAKIISGCHSQLIDKLKVATLRVANFTTFSAGHLRAVLQRVQQRYIMNVDQLTLYLVAEPDKDVPNLLGIVSMFSSHLGVPLYVSDSATKIQINFYHCTCALVFVGVALVNID